MIGRLFRRLFGRLSSAPVAPSAAGESASRMAIADRVAPREIGITPISLMAVVPNVPPSYDATAAWTKRLADVHAFQLADPELADKPDATGLLRLLEEGPESVIRQLPAAARDALTMCDDDGLSRTQLATRLAKDPALVQGLLRTANSAAIGGGRGPVLGIDQALDRIGVAGARAVVLASCVDGLLSHPGGEYNAMASDVWSHMVRTAPMARSVASAFAADPDEAFAIALLHDVGKLIIFDRISTLRATRRRSISLPPVFVHRLLQRLHEPLGALAALQWGMGDRAAAAIGTHHRGATTLTRDSLAEAIFVAEQADHAMRKNIPLDVDLLWANGRLTGSPARAASALHQLLSAA